MKKNRRRGRVQWSQTQKERGKTARPLGGRGGEQKKFVMTCNIKETWYDVAKKPGEKGGAWNEKRLHPKSGDSREGKKVLKIDVQRWHRRESILWGESPGVAHGGGTGKIFKLGKRRN